MRKSWFVSAVLLILVMLLTSVASAQSAPRVIPANDNFADAMPIIIGKSYTVLDIESATEEPGQPGTCCGIIYRSVWFKFSLPTTSDVYLSTGGTLLKAGPNSTTDTKIAVYSGTTLGTLSEMACADNGTTLAAELTFSAISYSTYYVLVGTYDADFLPESLLRLNTRMLDVAWTLDNGSFEHPLTLADWTVTNSTGDARICGSAMYYALSGTCAFRFVGNAGEASKLKQSMAFPSYFSPRRNAVMRLSLYVQVMETAALGNTRIKFSVVYTDGTPATVTKTNLSGIGTMGGYALMRAGLVVASKAVDSVQAQAIFKSTTGVLLLDYVIIEYDATVAERSVTLPVPCLR